MPATSTYKVLLETLTERANIGDVLGTVTGATTGWTASTSYVKGPFSNQRWPRGSPILTTAGTAINEASYIDQYTASTGAGTVEPDFSGTWSDGIIWPAGQGIIHPDQIKDCINRAHTMNCLRWQKNPLTFVGDGDYLGPASYVGSGGTWWAQSGVAATYVTLDFPETVGRAVQVSAGSTINVTATTIPARANEVWRFETAIRATTDGDTATFTVRDVLAGADITLTFEDGTGSTTSRSFVTQRGTFTTPGTSGTDARIAPRLTVSGSGTMTAQMAPVVMFPQDARSFPMQQRIVREDRIGNFYYGLSGASTSGPEERRYSGPITGGGRTATITQEADHFVVTFNFTPTGPVYYDELVAGVELSAMTDTTTFDREHVVRHALVYLYELLARHDPKEYAPRLQSAKRAALTYDHNNMPTKTVVGRV